MPKRKIKTIKKKVQPVEGRKNGRKIKVAKDKFADAKAEAKAGAVAGAAVGAAVGKSVKKLASRKVKTPKPQSLAEVDDSDSLAEGDGKTPLAPIKRKIKRKKKKGNK
ncbi:MAG: hypothetical protein Unbinned1322contig1000_63 [Prokaryotic dsDNA virus sp.]|nr:hypothetical protein [Aequorivita sp.]QDP57319.1 MAG: hypothetical protein Unbinned1322contig1000_63 [Prokaryotic dsDNA virus sp.]|tara:strand:+ start:3259 stop:3582 length:324 start_codon:yes stop_codon:yes gene_type:complete